LAYNFNPNQKLWTAGGSGVNTLAFSTDGYNWTGIAGSSSIISSTVFDIAYSDIQKLWVAVGQGTNTLAYSVNGFNWTGLGTTISAGYMRSIAYSDIQKLWIAGGNGGNRLGYSTNGYNWTGITGTSIFPGYALVISYSSKKNIWIAGGGYATNTLGYSTNGFNWSTIPSSSSAILHECWAVDYSEYQDLWIAGGEPGSSFAYSTNGFNWTGLSSNIFSTQFTNITYNQYLKIWTSSGTGLSDSLAYSTDGIIWTGRGKSVFSAGYSIVTNNSIWGPLPSPIIYCPFSTDTLNYASGVGVPFWYSYTGTGSVSIVQNITLNGSAGCVQCVPGTSCLMATTAYPNNTYTLPTNVNGYSISCWIRCDSNAPNGPFFGLFPIPNTGFGTGPGFIINGPGNTGTDVYCFTSRWNTGYSFTANVWHHLVITMTPAGAVSMYLNSTSVASASISGPGFTGTATYTSNSGINDLRIFGSGKSLSTTPSYGSSGGNMSVVNHYMSDFYYFDTVLTLTQIRWLHSYQAIH
jgi:hypothetical protein